MIASCPQSWRTYLNSMKNLFLLLTSIASIQLLIAQDFSGPMALTDENYDKISSNRSNPTVRGTIHGASAEELDQLVVSYTLVRPNDPFQVKYEAPILEDGTFTFTLPSNLPHQQTWRLSCRNYPPASSSDTPKIGTTRAAREVQVWECPYDSVPLVYANVSLLLWNIATPG